MENEKNRAGSLEQSLASARKAIEENKKIYVERHERRPANDADFVDRDRKWYDQSTSDLATLGFNAIGDVVNVTVQKAAGVVVITRRFISNDRTTMASIFQFVRPNPKTGSNIDIRVCDIESELSDANFIATSNADASKAATLPPQIQSTKYPSNTALKKLVELHQAAKQKALEQTPGSHFIQVSSMEEYEASQRRQDAIKAAFRQGIGYIDPAEVRRIAEQKTPDDPTAVAVATAAADIARRPETVLTALMTASDQGKSPADLGKIFADKILAKQGHIPAAKRDDILATVTNLFGSIGSTDKGEGLKGLLSLMGKLKDLDSPEKKEARRIKNADAMAAAQTESERIRSSRRKERLALGFCEEAGTGEAEPKIVIQGLPIPDIDLNVTAQGKSISDAILLRDRQLLAALPIGVSRVGGLPDLPPDHPWPIKDGKKIPFVAQINLADFITNTSQLLPPTGHLYAFALISNDQQHRPTPATVFLHQGDRSSLVRAPYPTDDQAWPDWTDTRVYQTLPAVAASKNTGAIESDDKPGDTLGWLGGEVEEYFGTAGEIADYRMQDGTDWINLLAIQSVGSMQWSDSGDLYLLIRRAALEQLDFSNVIAAALSS